MKIPFEIVSYYANIFSAKMAAAFPSEEFLFYQDLYYKYITSCGWSDLEFDSELLRRVNENWDLMYN